ncbi:efflux RND transporter permease subunit [Treponema sp. TIM-1]|uniref:efflux RND transporter permease subunit n=1 Tax=Treponema sp. TIM-1 TaxID=2898417 RepID=UPI0039811A7F
MMGKLAALPGLNLAFTQPITGRLVMLTTGVRTDLGIKLYGEDIRALQQTAFDIEAALAVPLGDLAQFRIVDDPSMISSEDGMPVLIIQMNTRGRDVVSFVNEANQVISEKVNLPAGYSYKWAGEFENQERAKNRLAIVVPIVIALMFFLLYMAFKSFSDAVLILLNIPFSLVGGIVAMYLAGTCFTVAAMVGYIALGGIALENGVIMITYIKQSGRTSH